MEQWGWKPAWSGLKRTGGEECQTGRAANISEYCSQRQQNGSGAEGEHRGGEKVFKKFCSWNMGDIVACLYVNGEEEN